MCLARPTLSPALVLLNPAQDSYIGGCLCLDPDMSFDFPTLSHSISAPLPTCECSNTVHRIPRSHSLPVKHALSSFPRYPAYPNTSPGSLPWAICSHLPHGSMW